MSLSTSLAFYGSMYFKKEIACGSSEDLGMGVPFLGG